MNNPFLSIVIPFCDKDYTLIPQLLKNIKEDVHISYEVILIDNRDKQRHQLIRFPKNTTVITKGYNCYQFEARRYAKDFCNGEYIWFVDADDRILEVKIDLQGEFLNKVPDIICFNSCFTSKDCVLGIAQNFVERNELERFVYRKQGEVPDKQLMQLVQGSLWNKWVRTSLIKEILAPIGEDLQLIASEDVLINELCFAKAEEICLCKDLIYLYKEINSHFSSKTVDNFFHITKGYDIYEDIKNKFIPDRNFKPKIDDCIYFLTYALQTENPEKCIKHLKEIFDETIFSAAINKCFEEV